MTHQSEYSRTKLVIFIVSLAVGYIAIVIAILNIYLHDITIKEICEAVRLCSASDFPSIPKGANDRGLPPEVSMSSCVDRLPKCNRMAKRGDCETTPGWMIINCPSTCKACHLLDPKLRCDRNRLNMSTTPAYKPGDMQAMFSSISSRFNLTYTVDIISESPWIITLDNFISDTEINALLSSVAGEWERSTDAGSTNEYGETGRIMSSSRTSSNAWCQGRCDSNHHVKNIYSKMEEIVGIPRENYESLQILRYEVGQEYKTHHDMSPSQNALACGPRILTFFLYLSDVEEGGETSFPLLGIKVTPKKGKAVLWPSTLNLNLEAIDPKTLHEALPVVRGLKYGANAWIHLYNYQEPNLWGCTGTFA